MSYAKLRGRIKEIFGTQDAFAEAMEMDSSSISLKLNDKTEWTRSQIMKACKVLQIPFENAPEYFFCHKS